MTRAPKRVRRASINKNICQNFSRTSAEILAAAISHPLHKDNTGSAQFSFHVNQNNTVNSRNSTLGSIGLNHIVQVEFGLSEPANTFASSQSRHLQLTHRHQHLVQRLI